MLRRSKKLFFQLPLLFLFHFASFSQVESKKGVNDFVLLKKEIRNIPVLRNDKEFIDFLNNKFDQFIKKKADTILLWYIENVGYGVRNYALIFSKTGTSSQVFVYNESYKTNHFLLDNDTLRNINIYTLYQIFQDDYVRSMDSTIISSHDDVIYCQFYFGNTKKLEVGFYNRVSGELDRNFQ